MEDDPALDAFVKKAFLENDFDRQTNQLTERAFALGSGAFVVYARGGETPGRVAIDYVTADHIFPLAWQGDEVTSCAFATVRGQGEDRTLYLMIHEAQTDGTYIIRNVFFRQRAGTEDIEERDADAGVMPLYRARARRYAIVKPNIANNISDAPLGISIYANAIDALKCIDLAYDGAKVAMETGRPRIGVTGAMLTVDFDEGGMRKTFDPHDIAVYDMGMGSDADKGRIEVKDLTTQYRATDFEASLQRHLQVYSQMIGLGERAFRWDAERMTTATQVVSENSAMLRAMEKHQAGLRGAIVQVVRAVLDVGGYKTDARVRVLFDDSVTRDRAREAAEAWAWVMAGKYPFWRYLVDFKGYDAADAKAIDREAEESGGRMLAGEVE